MPRRWDDEDAEDTRPDLRVLDDGERTSLGQRASSREPDPPDDDPTLLGQVMRQTVRNTAAIGAIQRDIATLMREVRNHQRGIDNDRPVLATTSARHASNRLAVLMGALFTVYELTSPYLREIWRQLVHR